MTTEKLNKRFYEKGKEKMKASELVQKINEINGASAEFDKGVIYVHQSSWGKNRWFLMIAVTDSPETVYRAWDKFPAINFQDMAKIFALVDEFLKTPLKNRLQRYCVPLRGLESDNGPQYLTTRDGVKYFACAQNSSLKQSFTESEFEEMLNLPQFKSTYWGSMFHEFIEETTE